MVCRLIGMSVLITMFAFAAWAATGPPAKPAAPAHARNMLYATGEGAMASAKEQPNRAKAYLAAKSYAKMQAIANLVQEAKGTIIEYTSTGRNYVAESFIKEQINGVLDSVRVVAVSKRSVEKDIIVAVTVRAPKPLPPKPPPTPAEPTPIEKTASAFTPTWLVAKDSDKCPVTEPDGYTSLIIDAQGLGASRCMSPKILRTDGSEVWGTVKTDHDFVCEYGIVAYARSRGDACTNMRAGRKPLVVRALRVGDSADKGAVVISPSDAAAIIDADRKTHFLDDFRVIVVVDRVDSFLGMKANSARR